MGDEFHFLFECNGLEKLRILVIPKYYRTRCSTLKMTQLLNTNDRKLLMKVAKFVHLGMKEYTPLPDVMHQSIESLGRGGGGRDLAGKHGASDKYCLK